MALPPVPLPHQGRGDSGICPPGARAHPGPWLPLPRSPRPFGAAAQVAAARLWNTTCYVHIPAADRPPRKRGDLRKSCILTENFIEVQAGMTVNTSINSKIS